MRLEQKPTRSASLIVNGHCHRSRPAQPFVCHLRLDRGSLVIIALVVRRPMFDSQRRLAIECIWRPVYAFYGHLSGRIAAIPATE